MRIIDDNNTYLSKQTDVKHKLYTGDIIIDAIEI